MIRAALRTSIVAAAVCARVSTAQTAAQQPVLLRGSVFSTDSVPLMGATVRILDLEGQLLGTALADSAGEFRIRLLEGAAVLVLEARMFTFAPARDTLVAARGDLLRYQRIVLSESAFTLSQVDVQASRPLPPRRLPNSPNPRSTANIDRSSNLLNDPTGDQLQSLAQIPGLTLVDLGDGKLGVTAFGMGAGDNNSTLNGSETDVLLPRDGLRQAVRLSSYDPRNGRFGGIQIVTEIGSGTGFVMRNARLSLSPSSFSIPAIGGFPQPSSPIVLSGTASGPIGGTDNYDGLVSDVPMKYYSVAAQLQRSLTPVGLFGFNLPSLPSPALLDQFAADAASLGIPVEAGVRLPRSSDAASVIARVDFTPYESGMVAEKGPALYLTAAASISRSGTTGLTPWTTSSRASREISQNGQISLAYAPYLRSMLSDTRLSFSYGSQRSDAFVEFPAVVTLVPLSESQGNTALMAGGNGPLNHRESYSAQLTSDWQWMSANAAHRFDAYLDYLMRDYKGSGAGDLLGTWEFNSVADMLANEPGRFSRTMNPRLYKGQLHQLGLAFSDVFYLSKAARERPWGEGNGLTLQGGVRLDADWFAAGSNAAGEAERAPGQLSLQPMLGLTWRSGTISRAMGNGMISDSRHLVTAGVRRYVTSPMLSAPDAIITGSDDWSIRMECLGSNTPRPNWQALAQGGATPASCLSGSGIPARVGIPSIQGYASDFAWPESWRSEFKWSGVLSSHFRSELGVTQSWNRRQRSRADLNLRESPLFHTSLDSRPVFVGPDDINPSTGLVPLDASRANPAIGRNDVLLSTLSSTSTLYQAGLTYNTRAFTMLTDISAPRASTKISFWYTYENANSARDGFSFNTAGDPRVTENHIPTQRSHAFQLAWEAGYRGWGSIAFALRYSPGIRYTPMVRGDVNGDGNFNDRAFIPASGALGLALDSLLPSLPATARRCIESQRGHMAAPGSCQADGGLTLGTIGITIDPYLLGLGRRGNVRLSVQNAIGGLDRLLHGERGAKGWGDPRLFVDQSILIPTGFDPASRDFRYTLNPAFGTAGAMAALLRQPAAVILDVQLELGRNLETQYLGVRALYGDGEMARGDSATFAWMWKEAEYSQIWQWSSQTGAIDSLDLRSEVRQQLDSIVAAVTSYRETKYRELAKYVARLDKDNISSSDRNVWHNTIVDVAERTYSANKHILGLMNAEERERLSASRLAAPFALDNVWLKQLRKDWLISLW